MNEKQNRSSVIKIIGMNLIGLILAAVVYQIAVSIFGWLFIDVLGKVRFITKILSWPVDYYYYALTGILCAAMAASFPTCNFFCNLAKSKLNYGTIIFGISNALYHLISMILTFINNGFNLSFLFVSISVIVMSVSFGLDADNEG